MNCFNDYQCILNHTYCIFISFYLMLFFSLQQISLEQLLIVIKIVVENYNNVYNNNGIKVRIILFKNWKIIIIIIIL